MDAKGYLAAAAVCAMLLQPIAGNAATVSMQNGAVLINNGKGFVPIGPGSELPAGSQIMVQPGGSASIAYAGNCTVRVGSGVWLVQAAPPCANGSTEIDFTARMNQQAPPTGSQGDQDPNGVLFWTGLVAAGSGVALAIGLANASSNGKPASP